MRCPSCEATVINGHVCHEAGCPDHKLILNGHGEGEYEHRCRECGCLVLSDNRHTYECYCQVDEGMRHD